MFLSSFDGQAIYNELRRKVENKEPLSDEDIIRFVILPLTKRAGDQKMIEETVNLAKRIENERQQLFIIAGILTAADKYIDKNYSYQVKGWLTMTQVARLYEEEKIEYGNQKIYEITKNLIELGADNLFIMKATGLARAEINKLRSENDADS